MGSSHRISLRPGTPDERDDPRAPRRAQPDQHVIVTGAAGFIGSHMCCRLLGEGFHVTGIDNFEPFYSAEAKQANLHRVQSVAANNNFHFESIDLRDDHRLGMMFDRVRPAAVFHFAALAGVRPSIAQPARYAQVNVNGTLNVLDAARAVGCRTVVFASSSSVYGNNQRVPFAEDDPVDEPISPYAATKRAGELICHTYAHLFGMRIAALRFFTVYGPAQRPDLAIAKFMRLIANGEEVPMFGDGTSSRDYTYIDDIIDGVVAAYHDVRSTDGRAPHDNAGLSSESRPAHDQPNFFRIWNLGNSHPITLAEMIDTIAIVVGKPARIKRLPMQPGDVEHTWADLTRSRTELGYQPRVKFMDGLRQQWEHRGLPTFV